MCRQNKTIEKVDCERVSWPLDSITQLQQTDNTNILPPHHRTISASSSTAEIKTAKVE